MAVDLSSIQKVLSLLTPQELTEIDTLLSSESWMPLPGPQMDAYLSEADELFYGGAAGGGKTDLVIGLCLTAHRKSIIFRREGTQLQGVLDRMTELLGDRDGFNGQERIWRLKDRQMELGSCPNPGDEIKYQGRPHDLLAFDEITHFLPHQYRFLCGWLRTTQKGQRCRVVCTGNPPTDSDGEWVVAYWGPWLDPNHPNPAKPGELRYYANIDGETVEVEDGKEIHHNGEVIRPRSRTFIPSRVEDNPFLLETDYKAQLQSLPEPLRSQMLKGDFRAGMGDDPWQIIPSEWVRLAQARWEPTGKREPMDSIGADVARGGKDESVISRRHGNWFAEILAYPGTTTPDGPSLAGLIVSALKDSAPIHVDVIGVGASVYDHLDGNEVHVIPVNAAESTTEHDKTGQLCFRNQRARLWWRMREALEPSSSLDLALPPDPKLRADLCAPRWKLTAQGIQVEAKDDLIKRIGRSPDRGDAVVMALESTAKRRNERAAGRKRRQGSWKLA